MPRAIPILCILAATAVGHAAQEATTTTPADSPATATAPANGEPTVNAAGLRRAEKQIGRQVDALVEVFRRDRYEDRQAAERELLALHEALFEPLANANTPAEERRPAGQLLRAALTETSIARELLPLSVEDRLRVASFRETHPDIVANIFSLSWRQQLDGYRQIGRLGQAATAAGPLLRHGLVHPSQHVVLATYEAVRKSGVKDGEIIDDLCHVLQNATANDWARSWYYRGERTHLLALDTLADIKTPAAAPTFLALVMNPRIYNHQVQAVLTDALVETGEKRAVPTLMDAVADLAKQSASTTSWSVDGKSFRSRSTDAVMLAAIRLSGQKPETYGFGSLTQIQYMPSGHSKQITMYGFPYQPPNARKKNKKAAEDASESARRRLEEWWKENKDKEPWKGMKPLTPADLPGMKADQR